MSLSSDARSFFESEAVQHALDRMGEKILSDLERVDSKDSEAARALAIRYQLYREFISSMANLANDEPLSDWRKRQAEKFQ